MSNPEINSLTTAIHIEAVAKAIHTAMWANDVSDMCMIDWDDMAGGDHFGSKGQELFRALAKIAIETYLAETGR